jgi:protein TonB
MAFYALLFSKSSDTNAAIRAGCKATGIRVEVCEDIFSAIEKAKTLPLSCVIADWAEQPEASFLLKRARESTPNRDTVAIAVVDHDPTAAEIRDNRLDFLIYRPVSAEEAEAVLTKAAQKMQPSRAADGAAPEEQDNAAANSVSLNAEEPAPDSSADSAETPDAGSDGAGEVAADEGWEQPRSHNYAMAFRGACAAVLVLASVFFFWRSREAVIYLSRTPEGAIRVLEESVAAFFFKDPNGALAVGSAGNDVQQDAYFSRNPASSNAQAPAIGVVATESSLTESRIPLHKASDFPLPVPVYVHQDPPPVHVERAAIPDSMRNSAPITPPVVETVTPAQMMPVSVPQPQPVAQQFSEPVAVSEDAERALLVHSVNPVYPPEAEAQKLHGAVVLQAQVGRDGSVEDLKIVRGNFVLCRAAIAAVKQWRFQPYTLNGHAAATQTVITINFSYPPG